MSIKEKFNISGVLINKFGQRMTHEEFYKFLFREYIEDVKAYGFLSHEHSNYSSSLPFKSVQMAKSLEIYASHFAISLFYKQTSRLKENIRYIVSIPFDIDWGKKGVQANKSEVWAYIKKRTGIEISALWDSKTPWCYHGLLRIEMMVGTPKSIHLMEWVAKELAVLIDADLGGTHANQWLRTGSGIKFEKFSDKIYNIDGLKRFLPSSEELERRQNAYNSDATSLEKYRVENHPAIKKLLSGDVVSWRNHACFTAALLLKMLNYSEDEALERLSGVWLSNVNGPKWHEVFRLSEVKSSVKSAFSGKYNGPSKEWIYNVTEIEFPYNLTYVRTKYKKADEVRVAIVQYLRERDGVVKTSQTNLAKAIGMPERSVKRNIKTLVEEGVISLSGKGGRYSEGSTFELLKDKFSKKNEVVIEVDFGYREIEDIS